MTVKISDYLDVKDTDFTTLTIFWDTIMLYAFIEEFDEVPNSEENFISFLSQKGKEGYKKIKQENPDWDFPLWLEKG